MSSLLLDEPPLVIQRSLVQRFGIAEAVIIQQLHYWSKRSTNIHEGERWVYKTYGEWADELGLSAKVVRNALDKLRRAEAVISVQSPLDSRDRTLWWRIDYAAVHESGSPPAPGGSPPAPTGTPPASEGSSHARVPDAVQRLQAETTTERTTEPRKSSVRYQGKRVPAAVIEGAEQLLVTFNAATGRELGARKADGSLSPAASQIVGAMLARPNVAVEAWQAAIGKTVAAPPSFIDGPLQIGHVFGERAAEWALAPPGPAAKTSGARRSFEFSRGSSAFDDMEV